MEEESDDKDDTKRKSRNLSEKKRRDQFNSLVNDLSALITTSNRKMDKSTVLKSTITFLKHHNEATDRSKLFEIQQDWKPPFLTNDEFTHLMLEAIDGFILVFSSSGTIYYASDNITSLLGYLPSDIMNMTIFELTHATNHETICDIFRNQTAATEPSFPTNGSSTKQVTFHSHVKRGNVDRLDLKAYELVKFVGYFRAESNADNSPANNTQSSPHSITTPGVQAADGDKRLVFVGTGCVVAPQLIREMSSIDPTLNEFTSKHSLEWKFLFLDHRAPPIIGYLPFEVLGTSGYDYYHFDDLDAIVSDHEELMQKGKGKSCYYRFLTKGQQWIWLQTSFYVSYHQNNSKPEYVVCTHKVFSHAEVIKQSKMDKSKKTPAANASSTKTSTVTLKDIECNHSSIPAAVMRTSNVGSSASAVAGTNLGDISPIFEQSKGWAELMTSTTAQPTPPKTAHPSSNYGHITSEDIPSTNIKRKRYSSQNCGNDSDSTSMSADSRTSRYSLLTHMSSHIKRRKSVSHSHQTWQQMHGQHEHQQLQNCLQQQQQQIQNHLQQQSSMHQTQTHALHLSQSQAPSKRLPMLQQHSFAPAQMMATTSSQFTPRVFPFQSPPLVGPAFLEAPQFLTAIPVQPVIAPFPLTQVPISPITVNLPGAACNSQLATLQTACEQHEMNMRPAAAFVMKPNQSQLQDQLQLKHDELQKLIMQQQDELRMVSEQLLLSRYSLQQQPLLPMNYNNASGGSSRSLHCVNNALEEHGFNQFGFAMTAGPEQQHQQTMLPQQQHLNTPQQQHLLQNSQHVHGQQSHQHQPQIPSQQHQDQQQNLFPRNVADLEEFGDEEIDAFLSPLQSLLSLQTALDQNGEQTSSNNNNHNISVIDNHNKNSSLQGLQQQNEDQLLSYIQMAPEPSLEMNFQMGLSDVAQSQDTKLLYNHLDPQPHQQPNSSYFPADQLESVTQPVCSDRLPNDLDILPPYQELREESQSLLDSSHIPPGV